MKRCASMRGCVLGSVVVIGAFSLQALAEDVPSTEDEARRARVFATVGDVKITVGELEDSINARSFYARKRFEDPAVLRQFADDRIKSEIFEQGAERLGYADDPEVAAFLDRTIMQFFIRKEIDEAEPLESISDEQVVGYYNEHPDEFRRPETRRARHILVGSRQEAKEIIAEIKAGTNTTFGAIAKQRSLDTETKLRGGDLLYFTKEGRMLGGTGDPPVDPALVKAAFALDKKGDIAPKPIAVGDGKWSVLQLSAIRPAKVETLQDAGNGIRRRLWRDNRKAALDKVLSDLRAELQPKSYPERVDAIVLQPRSGSIEPPNQ